MKTFLYTFLLAVFSTVLSALVGVPAAFFCARRKFWGRKLLLSLGIIPLCVPPLIVALANISCFGVSGFFSNGKPWLYSTVGIVMVQGFYNFPLITGIVTNAWTQLPLEQENAARLLGAKEGRVFFTNKQRFALFCKTFLKYEPKVLILYAFCKMDY